MKIKSTNLLIGHHRLSRKSEKTGAEIAESERIEMEVDGKMGTSGIESSYEATERHISLINTKRLKLQLAQEHAERQLIHRLASDFGAGLITAADVLAHYLTIRAEGAPGLGGRWNERMPVELQGSRIRHTVRRLERHRPDPDGNWRGDYPLDEIARFPAVGVSVVYVLFDGTNQPCYVGSTAEFRGRCKAHAKEGKPFTRWLAYPCADREAAYELEGRLLRQHQPYLNRKASR